MPKLPINKKDFLHGLFRHLSIRASFVIRNSSFVISTDFMLANLYRYD